jgi:hypothetical protein
VTGKEESRLHTAVLVGPEGERRRARKARKKAATRIETTARETRKAEAKARWEAEQAERRAMAYLPAAGEPGPAALRTPGRFRLPKHQDTSATLAGQYPFLAEGGLGPEGIFVGQDLYSGGSFVYDPWVLYRRGIITAPNVVLAGIVGSGKSSLAKSLYTRSLPFGRRVYVPGDPKGEHTAVAEAVGGRAIILGHGLRNRLNPLDEGHRPSAVSDSEWAMQVASRRRDLIGALAETVLDRALTRSTSLSKRPCEARRFRSCRWSSTASSPQARQTTRTGGSRKTGDSSATPCAGSWPATCKACSTGQAPCDSTRPCRWCPSTSAGSRRIRHSSRC